MADPTGISPGVIITVATSICGALTLAIAQLWRMQVKQSDRTAEKLDECHRQHLEAAQKQIEMAAELGELKGKVD